jgi:hypothetical protein
MILWLLSKILIYIYFLKKWFSPTRSETAEIGKKNRRHLKSYTRKIFQTLGTLSNKAACWSSLGNTRKASSISVLKKTSPPADTESELEVLFFGMITFF